MNEWPSVHTRARLADADLRFRHAIALNSCYVDRKELINVSYNYVHDVGSFAINDTDGCVSFPLFYLLFIFHLSHNRALMSNDYTREKLFIDLHKSNTIARMIPRIIIDVCLYEYIGG